MLRSDVAVLHGPGFLGRHFQNSLSTRCKGNHLPNGHHPTRGGGRPFDILRQFLKIHAQIFHDGDGHTLAFADQA